MKIEIGKKYTSNGQPIRILCTDRCLSTGRYDAARYQVIGLFETGNVQYFKENGESSSGSKFNLVEMWEPQEGEWCLFWDDEKSDHFVLARFLQITQTGNFCSYRHGIWKHCTKFDGTFPIHLKSLEDKDINMKKNTQEE
jgi:hypothetical protein